VINKIKNRLASEQGFTLIELLVVIIILGILVAIAVPAYLSFTSKAHGAAAVSNVRSAIPAAEGYYQDHSDSYTGLSLATLQAEAPGIPSTVTAGPNTAGDGYCIQDLEPGGSEAFYTGGAGGTAAVTGGSPGSTPGPSPCPTGYTLS
jgi:type IV pilus assembly protein PilA